MGSARLLAAEQLQSQDWEAHRQLIVPDTLAGTLAERTGPSSTWFRVEGEVAGRGLWLHQPSPAPML